MLNSEGGIESNSAEVINLNAEGKIMGTVMKTLNFYEDKIKEGLITLDKLKKL